MSAIKCQCGSGHWSEEIYDARGIYVTRACDMCRKDKLSGYRPEIFSNPGYEADEPIEPEEW